MPLAWNGYFAAGKTKHEDCHWRIVIAAPQSFVHLHSQSAFSFLNSSASVEALVLRAAELGQPALALTDTGSITGIPTLVRRCQQAGLKPIGGCEVCISGKGRLTLLADGPAGWASLSALLTLAALRDVKREAVLKHQTPTVDWEDLEVHHDGLVCLTGASMHGHLPVLLRLGRYGEAKEWLLCLRSLLGAGNLFVEVTRTWGDGEWAVSHRLLELADHLGLPPLATNPVHHAAKSGYAAYEALCRVRLGLAPHEQHAELPLNGEGYLKGGEAMARLFADRPDAIQNGLSLAERLASPLDPDVRHLPHYPQVPLGESPFSMLSELVWCGAQKRYGDQPSAEVRERLVRELETIRELGYCDYFLVCWDICREAKRRGVRHALRGSAVGSAAVYCLGMSEHDPISRRISFDRFLSLARAKPPDIDIDFRHDLRDDMMRYVRETYGDDRVANVSNYVTYRGRSLLRDLGKALGMNTGDTDRLRELLGHSRGDDLAEQIARTPELRALGIEPERYGDLFALCASLAGLPRHLGTHSSGIVVSDVPLAAVSPLQWAAKGVTVVCLDKEDVEAPGVGLLKIDQLSLRSLTAIDHAVETITLREPDFNYDGRDREDPETLAMIRAAQTVTCFQLESPAQMSLQWRLKADKFDDLVASVALIRPGPLLGKTVAPYIARRHGLAEVKYPLPELEPVLQETYGRILFQDQALDVVRVVGNFEPDEADRFQKAITHARSREEMAKMGLLLWERVKDRGMTKKAFSRLWKQIEGFSQYGFCHGHAVAFADHAQGTAWLLRHHPADFLAAVLSVEPCGFWPVSTVVAEAQRRGVVVHGPCVNRSEWQRWDVSDEAVDDESSLPAIRCSLVYVHSLHGAAEALVEERTERGAFVSLSNFCRRCSFLTREQLEWLVLAGALDGLVPNRRAALWCLPVLHQDPSRQKRRASRTEATGQGALGLPEPEALAVGLPDFTAGERYAREWTALGFSPGGHPLMPYREKLAAQGMLPCAALQDVKPGSRVTLAGLVLRPHRPPAASGTVFFTLEDESGLAQVTVFPDAYKRMGATIYTVVALAVTGVATKHGEGMFLAAESGKTLS